MTKKNRRSQSTTDGDVLNIVTDSCIVHGFRQEYKAVNFLLFNTKIVNRL